MKNLAITFLTFVLFALVVSSCHYGQQEANETIKRNEQYKSEKAEYSVNRAGDESSKTEVAAEPIAADTAASK